MIVGRLPENRNRVENRNREDALVWAVCANERYMLGSVRVYPLRLHDFFVEVSVDLTLFCI